MESTVLLSLAQRQDANKDDMQADRTLSMWANPSYNRIKKPQTYLYGMSISLYPFKFQKPGLFTGK